MRVWDINPGYLNRQSLLGEHRELHGLVSIIVNGKKGYSQHPETRRWVGFGWALRQRHKQLVCEMRLRGYRDRSPVTIRANKGNWPGEYIDEPAGQFHLLKQKYRDREGGRISLPENSKQLWRQHKYSVLARDPMLYKDIGRRVSTGGAEFAELALLLTQVLRQPPSNGGLVNAAQHMWGHVAGFEPGPPKNILSWSARRLLEETQQRSCAHNERYLMSSTALSELMSWLPGG